MPNTYIVHAFKEAIMRAGYEGNREKISQLFESSLSECGPNSTIYAATVHALAIDCPIGCRNMGLARGIYLEAIENDFADETVHLAIVKAVYHSGGPKTLELAYKLATKAPINNPEFFTEVMAAAIKYDNYTMALNAYEYLGENATNTNHHSIILLAGKNKDLITAETAFNRAIEMNIIDPSKNPLYGVCPAFIKVAATHQKFDLVTRAFELALFHKVARLSDLYFCLQSFPSDAHFLIELVLSTRRGLEYLGITDESEVEQLATHFPQFKHIFKAGNLEDVFKAADLHFENRQIAKKEIIKNAQYFLEARKTNSTLFPPVLEAEIASYTGGPTLTSKEAKTIAYKYLM